MWTNVVGALTPTKLTGERDWGFITTIRDNIDVIYDAVRAIVPDSFLLHKAILDGIITQAGG